MNKILISIIIILSIALASVCIYAYQKQNLRTQACHDMGYTKTKAECPNEFLRCMYDLDKVYCRNSGVK